MYTRQCKSVFLGVITDVPMHFLVFPIEITHYRGIKRSVVRSSVQTCKLVCTHTQLRLQKTCMTDYCFTSFHFDVRVHMFMYCTCALQYAVWYWPANVISLDYQLVLNYSFVYIIIIVLCAVFIHSLNSCTFCCSLLFVRMRVNSQAGWLHRIMSTSDPSASRWVQCLHTHHWTPDPTVTRYFNGKTKKCMGTSVMTPSNATELALTSVQK